MRALFAWYLVGLFATSLGWGWQTERDHLVSIMRDPGPEIDVQAPAPSPQDPSLIAAGREHELFDALEALPVSSPSGAGVDSVVLSAATAPGATPTAGCSGPPGAVSGHPADAYGRPPGDPAPRLAARVHVQIGLCGSLQDASDVAARAQSLGYSISLSNAGSTYEVEIAGDLGEAPAERLARTLRQAGFTATIVP